MPDNLPKSRRELAIEIMEAIADNADDARKDDLEDVDEPMVILEDNTPPESDFHAVEKEVAAAGKLAAAKEEKASEPVKFKVKINGQEKEISAEELIAGYQKNEAADENLRLSVEALKLVHEQSLSKPDEADESEVNEVARALQMGTEDEARQAVKKLLGKPSPDVSKLIDERVSQERARDSLVKAKAQFEDKYKDLLSDPTAKNLVYARDSMLAREEPNVTPFERWEKVAQEVLVWRNKLKPPTTEVQNKAARKASVTSITPASGRTVQGEDDDADDSPSAVIARMAEARKGRVVSQQK